MIHRTLFTAGLATLCAIMGAAGAQEPESERRLPAWANEVQTYNMLALTPPEALELNISVNGIWGGMGGNDPILPHPPYMPGVGRVFGRDRKAFVEASHAAGLIAVAAIPSVEGMFPIREITPNLEEMACRKADGSLALWGGPEEKCLQMCTNRPDWLKWEIEFGKEGIDAGADLVLVDTPQGQAVGNIIAKGGYCSTCMQTFREHLQAKYTPEELSDTFELDDLSDEALVARLKDPAPGESDAWIYVNRMMTQPLFHEFLLCQERAGWETRKELIEALRKYAQEQGRQVIFACNAFQMNGANFLGYWIRATMFADVFDWFIYENGYSPRGIPLEDVKPPREKWAAAHKLAYPIHNRRAVTVMGAGAMPRLFKAYQDDKRSSTTWMAVQCAEAYAANGAYSTYYFTPAGPEHPDGFTGFREALWTKAFDFFGFVQDHKDLYDGALHSGSPVAFLFLDNERGRTIPGVYPSYSGLAQGFIESNFPFDVVYAGDDVYVKDRLSAEDLKRYRTIIVPSPIEPTDNQKAVIRQFAERGGTVVCQEPQLLGFSGELEPLPDAPGLAGALSVARGTVWVLSGEVTETWTDDIGSRFFRDYEPALRDDIGALARQLDLAPILDGEPDGLVCAFPIEQPERERVVVHLVNYDIDFDNDAIREKEDLRISLIRPPFLTGPVEARLYTPGQEEPTVLESTVEGGTMSCRVPRMAEATSVTFTAQ